MNERQSDKGFFAQFADAVAGFMGTAAAKYRSYVAKQNQKLRNEQAQMRAQQAQQVENHYLADVYPATANFLMTAINDTASVTYLLPVQSIEKLYATTKIQKLPDGSNRLIYRGWARVGVPLSTQNTIQRILQKQLNVLTADYCFTPLNVAVKLCADNEVFFGITLKNSTSQGRKE